MSKRYQMKNLGIEALVGRHVRSAAINEEKDLVILDTDKGKLYLTWEGDCCAQCFLANVAGSSALTDATVLSAENTEWKTLTGDNDEVVAYRETVESMGTTIKTTKGTCTLESRVEHNGYYGGEIMVSDDEPMDTYHAPRYGEDGNGEMPETKPLEDF